MCIEDLNIYKDVENNIYIYFFFFILLAQSFNNKGLIILYKYTLVRI